MQIVSGLLRTAKTTSNNHKRRASAAALLAVVARATTSKSEGLLRSFLQRHLHEVQDIFLFLLADTKSTQLSRESCCLGLAACDKLVSASESDELKWRLLKSFGQTTNHGGSAMQETPQQAEERRRSEGAEIDEIGGSMTVVDAGGAAGMSEASLGAYREMAAAAVAAGRPDILYSLLILSVSHSIWFSSEKRLDAYGPAALQSQNFGKDEVKTALRPYLGRLLPRVLRASHDPNKQTRESMETLWVGLTGGGEEGRMAITEHLRPTMDTLIDDTSSKFWRARVGACGALGQIIVGRSWQDLGGGPAVLDENYDLVLSKTSSESTLGGIRLLRLWRAATRALDDVRIAVRESGESLARSVRSLTINLCSPNSEPPDGCDQDQNAKDAIAASATSLSWLLRDGLKQQSPEAAGICVSALIGIIDVAKPAILEALLSDVIFALLMALSNLEPAAFSYLAVREERGSTDYENLARLRIQASQSSPLAVAIRKCLAMMPKASQKNQEAVVPAVESAIRKSAGMATRTTAAECVITLCHSCPGMFRSNTSSSSLLRCFFDAVFQETSGKAVQDKMVSAFGSLAALCPGTTVRSLATSATNRYKHAHGSNDDSAARVATAMVLRSLAVKSSNHFIDGGNSDIWCREVLPISFLGMRDPDENVASLWKDVWEDGGAAVDLGLTEDNAPTLDEKLLLSLVTECVKALEDVSWSRRVAGAEALSDLADRGILAPPPRRLSGEFSVSDGRRAKKRADASRCALSSLVHLIARNRIWSGKKVAVQSTVKVATRWVDVASLNDLKAFVGGPELVPITFGDVSAEDDLFVSDQWFETVASMEDCDQDDSQQASDHKLGEESPSLTFVGLCRLLLIQAFPSNSVLRVTAEEEVLPYRSEVIRCLDLVLHSLSLDRELHIQIRSQIFNLIAPKLLSVIEDFSTKESPLIVARCVDCFAASFWRGIMFRRNGEEFPSIDELSALFLYHADLTKQAAWTIREASAKAASRMAECAHIDTLRQRQALGSLMDISAMAIKDKRFWKVRLAGVEVLHQIVLRAGTTPQHRDTFNEVGIEKQLMLESILPHKESIQRLASRCLSDAEAAVTALSTKVLNAMATWP
jgi:proteasome component ECM29